MTDELFIKNLKNVDWTLNDLERAKRLVKEGRLEYIKGFHCGYYKATES